MDNLKDALKYLAEHVNKHGGMASASECTINVPLKKGARMVVAQLLPNGTAEILYPIDLTKEVTFGRYYVGCFLLKLNAPEITS